MNNKAETLKLSIIIPVYNIAEYISECLDSCLKQDMDYGEYEIICVNDGSTDNSEVVLSRYAEKYSNIRVISQKNQGVSAARNRGIKEACGKYVWFIDGDDYIIGNCLSSLIEALEENSAKQLFFGMSRGTECRRDDDFLMNFNYKISEKRYTTPNVCSCIFSKNIIEVNKITFDSDMKYGEDTLFVYKYSLFINDNEILISESPIYYYRQRRGSAMNSSNMTEKHMKDMLTWAKKYKKILNTVPLSDNLRSETEARCSMATAAYLFDTIRSKNKANLKELKKDGLYPYKLLWFTVKPNRRIFGGGTANQYIAECLKLLFPFEWYYNFLYFIFNLKNKKKGC